jgi:metalloendopeptidase OMA1, mitochondrial
MSGTAKAVFGFVVGRPLVAIALAAAVVGILGVGSSLPFSRSQESEADHIGLIYMARAGYDPHQAVAFWKRMQRASRGQEPPEFLSDHPSDAHCVARVQGWLPEAEREYRPHA